MIHKNVNVYEQRGCAHGYETKKNYNTTEQSSYIFIHYIMYIEILCILGRNVQLIKVSGHSEQISSRNTTKIVAYNNVKKNIYQKKNARTHIDKKKTMY